MSNLKSLNSIICLCINFKVTYVQYFIELICNFIKEQSSALKMLIISVRTGNVHFKMDGRTDRQIDR